MSTPTQLTGLVTASYGRHYRVETESGLNYQCVGRSKQSTLACGDRVMFTPTSLTQGVIHHGLPRNNLLYRSVAHRAKLIAANVDQIIIVVAPVPSFYELLLNRCLIAAQAENIPAIICVNKTDLGMPAQQVRHALAAYESLGHRVISVSAHRDIHELSPLIQGKVSVFVGQSGMGKSSLINTLVPEARSTTQEISQALDSGKHTTTSASMYKLAQAGWLIDSPGMQVFGLKQIKARELDHHFLEFRPYLGQCRFNNCMHLNEPGCAIRTACEQGDIHPARIAAYLDILGELMHA